MNRGTPGVPVGPMRGVVMLGLDWQQVNRRQVFGRRAAGLVVVLLAAAGGGCRGLSAGRDHCRPPQYDPACLPDLRVPKELNKISLPPYVIETPDVLVIEAGRVVPLPPYRVEPLDQLYIVAKPKTVYDDDPINGIYPVGPDGTVDLGRNYGGTVRVADLTVDEAKQAILTKVLPTAPRAELTVALAQARGLQGISGQHIVGPDGTVSLGTYGNVYVTGMTRTQARQAIEEHLSKVLYRPEVSVDVYSYNSKSYYVITDFAGAGEQVVKLPHTGNETVLDAVANVGGLSAVSSNRIWVARPAPTEAGQDQVLPVDWCGVTQKGRVGTNYQLLPGDRVYIMGRPLSTFDTNFARIIAPLQRTLGLSIYGASTYQTFQSLGQNRNGNNGVTPFIPIVP